MSGEPIFASELSIDEKSAELATVLRSKEFSRSPALARLLEYLCTKTFTGREYEIKEFSIATEVFGRGEDFVDKRDSLVRVEVHRLRKKLQSYYDKEGADRPIRIVIRPGNYQPDFHCIHLPPDMRERDALEEEEQPEPINAAPERGRKKWMVPLAVATSAALLGFAASQLRIKAVRSATPGARTKTVTPLPVAAGAPKAIRILAGSTTPQVFDRFGEDWEADRYFSGGFDNILKFGTQERSVRHPAILGAADQTPFRTFRAGDFSYAIPLARTPYEMRLYFSEVVFGIADTGDGADNDRISEVSMNGKTILPFHDIYSDAGGPDTADVHVFENVVPAADGLLHLDFHSLREPAWLNAIELIPNASGKPRPVRIIAQNTNFTDGGGALWQSDRYFLGGRETSDGKPVSGVSDPELFSGVRYGHFSYRIPAAPGKYTLRLYFAETFFGPGNRGEGGIGSRIFNVYCSGTEILRNFDIFHEAGQNHALVKVFRGISPNPAGRIDITFEPVVNYAVVYALELLPEDSPEPR